MRCVSLVCTLFLLLLFGCGGNDTAGTTSETDIGIVGTLVNEEGQEIAGAEVIAFTSGDDSQGAPVDTVLTDADGVYNFTDLPTGSYNFVATYSSGDIEYKVVVYTIDYDAGSFTDSAFVLGIDTLVSTGAIVGTVRLESGVTSDVAVYIPGTSIYGNCSDGGAFELSGIPQGSAYTIRFSKEGYITKDTTAIQIEAGKTTLFEDTVILTVDPNAIVEPPIGLKAEWDQATSTVKIEWDKVNHPNFAGVLVYRKDTTESSASTTLISGANLVQGESFIDTVPPLVVDDTVTYAYQLKSQNKKGDPSAFSWPVYVTVIGSTDALPAAVTITEPQNGATGLPKAVTVKWTSAGEGVSYILHVWQHNGPINDTMTFTTADTLYSMNLLRYDQEFRARVESKNATGSTLGPIISFTIEPEPIGRTIGSEADVWDTFIASGVAGGSSPYSGYNYGGLEWMTIGEHDARTATRGLLYFSKDRLPTKKVSKATLVLTVSNWVDHSHENSDPMTIAVHKVLKQWSEGDSIPQTSLHVNSHQIILDGIATTVDINGVTAEESSWGTTWNAPMLALDDKDARSSFEDTTTHTMSDGVDFTWEFDITALVNEWILTPATNYGLLLKPLTENYAGAEVSFPVFYTWEQSDVTKKGPQLILE